MKKKGKKGKRTRTAWNSTLKPGKKLKGKTFQERFATDPLRYGPLWDEVRKRPCFGRRYLPGHECGPGMMPSTAHHLGKLDMEGMVPCCGKLHQRCHERWWVVETELKAAGSPTLAELGKRYVEGAIAVVGPPEDVTLDLSK